MQIYRRLQTALGVHTSMWSIPKPLIAGSIGILLGFIVSSSAVADELKQSGNVHIEQVQIAFIGSGNLGGGTLSYGGQKYNFKIGGLGIGGFGISKITATGTVYNLTDVKYFAGAYGQARAGLVVGQKSTGKLWLENPNGVVMELKADREGLALSLGADAVYIKFN